MENITFIIYCKSMVITWLNPKRTLKHWSYHILCFVFLSFFFCKILDFRLLCVRGLLFTHRLSRMSDIFGFEFFYCYFFSISKNTFRFFQNGFSLHNCFRFPFSLINMSVQHERKFEKWIVKIWCVKKDTIWLKRLYTILNWYLLLTISSKNSWKIHIWICSV